MGLKRGTTPRESIVTTDRFARRFPCEKAHFSARCKWDIAVDSGMHTWVFTVCKTSSSGTKTRVGKSRAEAGWRSEQDVE